MKLFFGILLFSLQVFPKTYGPILECEALFLKGYSKYFTKMDKLFVHTERMERILKIGSNSNSQKRMMALESEYNDLHNSYRTEVDELEKSITKTGKDNGLDEDMIESMIEGPRHQILIDHLDELNEITNIAFKTMQERGMKVSLGEREVLGTDVKSFFIVLDDFSSKEFSQSLRYLEVLKRRSGVEHITFDFAQNMSFGFAGFSDPSIARIDLGLNGLKDIIVDDLLGMVAKHEFMHGFFLSKRMRFVDSIYHAHYSSSNGKALTSVDTGYKYYMQAEELYNFANNPNWGAERMKDIKSYSAKDYLLDIENIEAYIKESSKVIQQSKELSNKTIRSLKNLLRDDIKLVDSISFLKSDGSRAETTKDIFTIVFNLQDEGIIYRDWINANLFKDDLTEILNNRLKIISENKAQLDLVKGEELELLKSSLRAEDVRLNSATLKKIVQNFIEKQEKLNLVATKLMAPNEKALLETQDILSFLEMRSKLDPKYLKSKEFQEKLDRLIGTYSDLGKLVREDFSGFIGR